MLHCRAREMERQRRRKAKRDAERQREREKRDGESERVDCTSVIAGADEAVGGLGALRLHRGVELLDQLGGIVPRHLGAMVHSEHLR